MGDCANIRQRVECRSETKMGKYGRGRKVVLGLSGGRVSNGSKSILLLDSGA